MTAREAFHAGILFHAWLSTLNLAGHVRIPWWWLLWPFWLAIPLYLLMGSLLVVFVAIAAGGIPLRV